MTAHRTAAALVSLALLAPVAPAQADNPMGYRLFSDDDAAQATRGGGTLGLQVGRAQRINDGGMTFDVMGVRSVARGSPASQAGLAVGDDLIAVDGRVFPDIRAFAAYVGAKRAGEQIAIDYIPRGGGPQQAQRVSVTMGTAAQAAAPQTAPPPQSTGMSTGEKLAIGAGAVALLGCYEMGCFRHRTAPPVKAPASQAR